MSPLSPRNTLLAGVALILVVNAIALGGVAYNRSGTPDSVLRLSERELQRPYVRLADGDDSGVVLELDWRVPVRLDPKAFVQYGNYYTHSRDPAWLDAAKLGALGFDVAPPKVDDAGYRSYALLPRREVLLVLEFQGPAYQEWQAQAARLAAQLEPDSGPQESLRQEIAGGSRLFVVDAGLEAASLRRRYPDRSRHAIVPGTVRQHWSFEEKIWRLTGSIVDISVGTINVPKPMQKVIGARRLDQAARRPFQASVAFGKRFEPWLLEAR